MNSSLTILPLFESYNLESPSSYHTEIALHSLKNNLPPQFFDAKENQKVTFLNQKILLEEIVPFISFSKDEKVPGVLTFFALVKYRANAFKFFFEMLSRWLIPGQRQNVVLVYASDFRLPEIDDEVYTICEIKIRVETEEALTEIERNFALMRTEIALGMESAFYAQRILDVKGSFADDKTAAVHGFIAALVRRFPEHYNCSVFNDMQHTLVMYDDDFKAARRAHHLCRMICVQFLFRKNLHEMVLKNSRRRHLCLKVFRSQVRSDRGFKKVLSIMVGITFLNELENFCEKKFQKAIEQYIPSAQIVDNTFFVHKLNSKNICLAYIEIEKSDGSRFSPSEIRRLRRELPHNLKNRVEYRMHTIFMPRNEEEVMRGILTLTNQLKYVRDIPQVFITFDEQADAHLYFTVILARLLKRDSFPIAELFKSSQSSVEYLHDRIRVMGFVRKKYPKEATVFRLKLHKEDFLRADHSIDLYKARQTIVSELINVVGEVRDYNGGMISKQHALLTTIRESLTDTKEVDDLLLDNFFYSLSPVVVRALVDPLAFKRLYIMLLEGLKEYKSGEYYLKFHRESYNVFALVISEDSNVVDFLKNAIQNLHIPSSEIAYATVKVHGVTCLGYICCAKEGAKKEALFSVISESLTSSAVL